MTRATTLLLGAAWFALPLSSARAETVVQQCGQQYQAAKAAGSLNGLTWGEYRTDCTARLKTQPASASAAPPEAPGAAAPAAAAPAVTPAAATAKAPPSAGRAAMLARERQCGAEWRSTKATLIAQTPGLKWPQYWSQCNTRLKAAAH